MEIRVVISVGMKGGFDNGLSVRVDKMIDGLVNESLRLRIDIGIGMRIDERKSLRLVPYLK